MTHTQLAPAPQWLVDKLGPVGPQAQNENSGPITDEIDTDYAIQRALAYIRTAENAVVGAGASDQCYRVAAHVKDYGISEDMCLGLLLEHWNPDNSPVLAPEDLQERVANAYRYGKQPVGVLDPVHDFDAIEPEDIVPLPPAPEPLTAKPIHQFEPKAIPPRRWILGNMLLARKVSMLIAQAGMGKSTLGIAVALAVAANDEAMTGFTVHQSQKVWLINNEDDEEELQRRLAAHLQHFQITWPQILDRLYLNSGEQRRLIIARKNRDGLVLPVDRDAIVEIIRRENIGVLVVDPYVETVDGLSENSNEDQNRALSYYRDVAQKANCAVLVIHHTRKLPQASSDGHAGNMDSARGASSMTGVARVVATLYGMSDKDARTYGVPPDQKHLYVRYDDAKGNMALVSPAARWFKRVGVPLGQGDEVGILQPIPLEQKVQPENDIILASLVSCMADENRRRLRSVAEEIAENNRAVLLNAETGKALAWGAVQNRLKKMLGEEPYFCGAWSYDIRTTGGDIRQAQWIVRSPLDSLAPDKQNPAGLE